MSVIHPRHFGNTVAESSVHAWYSHRGQGAMRHVAEALKGQMVWAELDTQTGSGALVEIIGCTPAPALLVRHHHADGGFKDTAYPLQCVGTIVETEHTVATGSARWVATETLRNEEHRAVEQSRAAHPERNYGKWEARALLGKGAVSVTYTPQRDGAGERLVESVLVASTAVLA